jgi:UDP-N-acetylmuramoyl-tripeptide--D-alanyl-D-alanine ligase
VAITGSVGKTTTKEIAAELLATRYNVLRNRGNLNNHIGLPLSLLDLRRRPDMAVVEFGMNHPGEIRTLVGIAEPEVRVWTNVAEVHAAFFASIEAIAEAKAEILEGADQRSLLVANADDPRVMRRARGFAGDVITFGLEVPADVRAVDVHERGLDGVDARLITPAGERSIRSPLAGRGHLANLLAAIAVAMRFDVPLDAIAARVPALAPATRRGQVLRLAKGVTVIDDSYNASPVAVERALAIVSQEHHYRRRVAVLGEMLELGARAEPLHAACGRRAAAAGLDLLIAVGGRPAEALAAAAGAAGLPVDSISVFGSSEEAADAIGSLVREGDLVLVKGSRGIGTDRIVDRLRAEFG